MDLIYESRAVEDVGRKEPEAVHRAQVPRRAIDPARIEDREYQNISAIYTESRVPPWIGEAASHVHLLTPRQLEALQCLAGGMDGRALAKALNCSDRTAKLHTSEIARRLGVKSRLQAGLVGYHLIMTGRYSPSERATPKGPST